MSDRRFRLPKVLALVIAGVGILAVLLVTAFYIVANSSLPVRLIQKYDRQFMDADLEMSGFSLRGLGALTVNVDSLRIVYPHGTFPEPLENELSGSGLSVDTLLSATRLNLRFRPLRMLRLKHISLPEARIEGLRAYLRNYDDSTSNLSVFRSSESSDSSKTTHLKLAVRRLCIAGNPVIEYSDRSRSLYARLELDSLSAGGLFRISPEVIDVRKAYLAIDSLGFSASSGKDSYRLDLPWLRIDENGPGRFDAGVRALASARTQRYGVLRFPLNVQASFGMEAESPGYSLDFSRLEGNVAHIPLSMTGLVRLGDGSPYFKLDVSAPACPMDTLMREYSAFVPGLDDILYLDGRLGLDASLDGSFSDGSIPQLSVNAKLPRSGIVFKPRSLQGRVSFSLDADVSSDKTANAVLHELSCDGEGFDVTIGAESSGLLSGDPEVELEARLAADLDKLTSSMDFGVPVAAGGDLDLSLEWNARLSNLRAMSFDNAAVNGRIVSNRLMFSTDSLDIKAFESEVGISSGPGGIALALGVDSLFLDSGAGLSIRLRNTLDSVSLAMAPRRGGGLTPKITIKSTNRRAFVKTGPHRFFGRALELEASAHKRDVANLLKRNLFLDSLQKVYPDVPRRELLLAARDSMFKSRQLPAFLADKSLEKGDIDISLDTSKANLLREWSLKGNVAMSRGGFASTVMPLRTRFSGLNVHYDGRNLSVDTLGIVCGTSDLGIKGHINGLGQALLRKSNMDICADLHSRRINLNEIVSAFEVGKDLKTVHKDAEDVSFITDTLQDVIPELPPMKLVIVPANVKAEISAILDSIDFTYFRMNPLNARILMKDRTLQFIDSGFLSDYGDLSLDAFYSTISRKDISAGANLSLSDLDAGQIIAVLPVVDTLLPALKTFNGKFDCDVSATAKLDTNMNILPSTLDGLLRIKGTDLHFDDAGPLRKFTNLLMFKNKNIGAISDFTVSAVAHDNKLEIFPFEFSVDRYRVALFGMQNLDRSLFYHISLLKSPFLFNFGINIYGTLDKWRWSLAPARYKNGKVPTFATELDEMQVNISDYVRNIFNRGVSTISTYNRKSMDALKRKESDLDISVAPETLSREEYRKIDAALVEYQLEQEQKELDSEIESVLEDSYEQTSRLIESYISDFENTAYDSKLRRKMERMKNGKH